MIKAFGLAPEIAGIISEGFLAGTAPPPALATHLVDLERDIVVTGVRELLAACIDKYPHSDDEAWKFESDRWLAPRLHYLLRLRRRDASDARLWRWLSLTEGADYVRYRWADDGRVKLYRYLGGSNFLRRNALARLWWGAEMTRNGTEYAAVAGIFLNAGTEQYGLDPRYAHLRAAAIAFARVAKGPPQLKFDALKRLSVRANLLLSGAVLESFSDASQDADTVDSSWYQKHPPFEEVIDAGSEDLAGPADDTVGEEEIAEYERWFREVAALDTRQRATA